MEIRWTVKASQQPRNEMTIVCRPGGTPEWQIELMSTGGISVGTGVFPITAEMAAVLLGNKPSRITG